MERWRTVSAPRVALSGETASMTETKMLKPTALLDYGLQLHLTAWQ